MKGIIKELLGWLVFIFIVVAASYLVITYVGQRTEVSGSSMETTLSDGDQLIVDKISYRFREPSRYDIVVFPYRYEENTYYIKRIIGLPGETVTLKEGKVYINDSETPLEEPYLAEPVHPTEMYNNEDVNNAVYQVPEGCYFMMGDNRNHSLDARFWVNTYVPKDKIIAKVLFSYFPKLKLIE